MKGGARLGRSRRELGDGGFPLARVAGPCAIAFVKAKDKYCTCDVTYILWHGKGWVVADMA